MPSEPEDFIQWTGFNLKVDLNRDVPAPVSYTHLDVYKRQDITYHFTLGIGWWRRVLWP